MLTGIVGLAVDSVLNVFIILLIVRAVMSFFPVDIKNPLLQKGLQFIYQVTEPVLSPVRRVIPSVGGLDLSFLVVFFGVQFLRGIL